MSKNRSINFSGKYCQKIIDHAKQSGTDALKTTQKRAIQKTAEETNDLTGTKIADKVTGTTHGKSIAPMQTEIQLKVH